MGARRCSAKLKILTITFGLIALGLAAFIGFDRWQDDDDGVIQFEPQPTARTWSAAECAQARTTLDNLQTSQGWCRIDSVEACVELQFIVSEYCP